MQKRRALGLIKVNNNIIVQNAPVDKKFWDIYLICCANEASLKGVELVKAERKINYGYHLYFDRLDFTASVVCFKIRLIKEEEEQKPIEYVEVQQSS